MEYPVTYEMCGIVEVKAETLAAAMEIAANQHADISLPADANYVDGSWALSMNEVEDIRSCFNANRKDDGGIVYFEIELGEDEDEDGEKNVMFCGRGVTMPTIEQAQVFYQKDCEKYGLPVFAIESIDEATARSEYDFDEVDTWPVFGLPVEINQNENNWLSFFEMELRNNKDNDIDFICGKGIRIPSVEEANEFYVEDCKDSGEAVRIITVNPIPEAEAHDLYSSRSEHKRPVFGLPRNLETPRGNLEISAWFDTQEEAKKEGYSIYFTHEEFDVYTSHPIPEKPHHTLFALVPRGK